MRVIARLLPLEREWVSRWVRMWSFYVCVHPGGRGLGPKSGWLQRLRSLSRWIVILTVPLCNRERFSSTISLNVFVTIYIVMIWTAWYEVKSTLSWYELHPCAVCNLPSCTQHSHVALWASDRHLRPSPFLPTADILWPFLCGHQSI